MNCSPTKQSGVGLIEILVAVVIISVGFLAVAKMQIEGMRYSQSAYFNAQASLMLKDISDRMRSNRAGVLAGNYDSRTTAANLSLPSCVSANLPCNAVDLAQKDIAEWSAYLHEPSGAINYAPALPSSGSVAAVGTITPNLGTYDISVTWSEKIDGSFQTQSLAVQFIP